MLDFNIEEYKEKQVRMQKKDKKIKRKKKVRQTITGLIVFTMLMLVLSVTEIGCKQIQEYINYRVAPFIEQTKKVDENVKYNVAYLRYSDHFRKLIAENFKDSFLITLQHFVAYTNSFSGRNYQAFKTFEFYHTYFSHIIPKEEALELMFWEISTSKDAGQYKSCGELMDAFFYEYDAHPQDAGKWYDEVRTIHNGWLQVNGAIRGSDQPQVY